MCRFREKSPGDLRESCLDRERYVDSVRIHLESYERATLRGIILEWRSLQPCAMPTLLQVSSIAFAHVPWKDWGRHEGLIKGFLRARVMCGRIENVIRN